MVEDDVILRYALGEWLRAGNYDVVEAASGDEAVTILSSIMDIDVVITDVQMPGSIDGYALARHIRTQNPALPVVIVSGTLSQKDIDEIAPSAFYRKPYDYAEINCQGQESYFGRLPATYSSDQSRYHSRRRLVAWCHG